MSSFDQRPAGKSIPGWVIALGIFWGLASVVGVFFVGRKIVGTVRKQQAQLPEVGPGERAIFLTPEELVQSGLWHETKKAPREAEIKAEAAGSMIATLHGVDHNRTVVEVVVLRTGPSWMTEPVLHQSARFALAKKGFEEKADPPLGPDRYPTYRYCKGEECRTRAVIGALEQSGIYLIVDTSAPFDPDKVAAALKATLQRAVEYEKRHSLFGDDAGTP